MAGIKLIRSHVMMITTKSSQVDAAGRCLLITPNMSLICVKTVVVFELPLGYAGAADGSKLAGANDAARTQTQTRRRTNCWLCSDSSAGGERVHGQVCF